MTRSGFASFLTGTAVVLAVGIYGCGSDGNGTGDTDGGAGTGGSGGVSGGGARDGGGPLAGATGLAGNGTAGGSVEERDGGSADGPHADGGPKGGSGGTSTGGRGGNAGAAAGGSGGQPVMVCNAGAVCSADCTRSCDGGRGTIKCICDAGHLFCGACEPTPPPLCPAMPEGKDCNRDTAPICTTVPDGGADARCVCDARGHWSCPPTVTDVCPAEPQGKTCDTPGDTCSISGNRGCVCARQAGMNHWLCF